MLLRMKKSIVGYSLLIVFLIVALCDAKAFALENKPDAAIAKWSGQNWGIVKIAPRMARYGDQISIHGIVVGGPAAYPFWSCSQYSAWTANGTSSISISIPGDWDMPNSGIDYFGSKVNVMTKDAGDPPPYGWENRISDTCYCFVTDFGASGGCESGEVQPLLFRMMDLMNPREGNVKFATVLSGSGWTHIGGAFEGHVGVGWFDRAADYVYVVSDDALLNDDLDQDGLPDAWEYAHSPKRDLDDFAGGDIDKSSSMKKSMSAEADWINPYAPGDPGWISAGPNDWDGDGVSNKDEYLKWKDNKRDSDNWSFDPTFINTPCIDVDNDTYGQGCAAGPDCDDTDAFYTTICQDCPVKVIPKTFGKLIGDQERTRWLLIIGERGTDFGDNATIKWESNAIGVVKTHVFFKRFMLMQAKFNGEPLETQDYRVLVNSCEGKITWER